MVDPRVGTSSIRRHSDAMVAIAMNEPLPNPQLTTRRRRFQRGSLQKRKSGRSWNWIAYWWEDGHRRSQILGPCSTMHRPQALAEMAKRLQPVNERAGQPIVRKWTVGDWIREAFLPFIRRKWKLSTASTSGDRIRKHLIADFESLELQLVTRDFLQRYLEQKAATRLSFSVVDHLRWDLRAIFRLAVQEGYLNSNPAELLFTPRTVSKPSRQVLSPKQVREILGVLDLREQLLVHLALFSGMRPGEILALQWKHVGSDHVHVMHRLYRGKLDRPKTVRSQRKVALSSGTQELIEQWRERSERKDPEAWVFPSAKITRPLERDNTWRRLFVPRLEPIGLEWATFQIMRRTHASLSREAGIDPKLVADQLGHALGVNLDVYTIAALDKRRQAVEVLEASLTTVSSSQPAS
jgi:integrase